MPGPNAIRSVSRRLAALALAWPCACFAVGFVPPDTVEPRAPSPAAAFDAVFERVIGPASLDATTAAYEHDLDRLQRLLPPGDRARQVRFRSVFCDSTRWKDPDQGLAYSEQTLQMARAAGDRASEARSLLCRSAYLSLRDGSRHGLPDIDRALAVLDKLDEPQLEGEALQMRGDLRSLIGDQAQAMLDFQRARAAFRDSGIGHEVEFLLQGMAIAYRRMGDYAQAMDYFQQARPRLEAKQDFEGLAVNLIQLGFLQDEAGVPNKAQASFEEAIRIATTHDDPIDRNAALLGLAEAQIALDQPKAAQASLRDAAAGFAQEQDDSSQDMLLLLGGKALAKQGLHAQALQRYALAQPLMEAGGNLRYLAMLQLARATSEEALGRNHDALASFKRYDALQQELQDKMRLEQGRLLRYEYEIRQRDFENQRLRAERQAQAQQLSDLQRIRRWQTLAMLSGLLLAALLAVLAWREWRKSRRLRALSLVDPLTGAASRRAFDATAANALAEARRTGLPLSLLALDLDRFKAINDRYGHPAGDSVLAATSRAWMGLLRDRDLLARIGGEEFVVVCPDATLQKAHGVATRLLEATEALRFDDIDPALRVGVSIGIAQIQPGDTLATLHSRADAALYRAKQTGRGRVEG
ncbi:MAG: tetratricopeptide repeat-containing diguanylate cyclase [Lysobacterales bacterium]